MATKWISPTWRMPDEQNQSKFENYSLSFDGAENINIGNDISVSGNCTVSFWFKVPAIPDATGEVMFARYTGSSDTDFLIIGLYKQGVLASNNSNSSGSKITKANITLAADTWYHCAVTKVSGVVTNIYIDGTDRAGSVATFEWWSAGSTDSGFIGQKTNSDSLFDGEIEQLAVFDYTLTSTQISYLYNSGTPVNPMAISGNAPIAYYPLGGSSTGSASTLTVPNESVPSATVFDFDGSNNYIDFGNKIGNLIGDNYTGGVSFSFWLNPDVTSGEDGIFTFGTSTELSFLLRSNSFRLSSSGTQRFFYNYTNTNNEWAHCVLSLLPSGSAFYLNGQSVITWTYTDLSLDDLDFYIGYYANNPTTLAYNGKLSNFQIWNTNLSAPEVTTLYNNGVPLLTGTQPQAANIQAWYKMNVDTSNWDGSNWIIGNSTANYSTALNFANNAKISAGSITSLNNVSNASYSFWFYPTSSSGNIGFIGGQSAAITAYFFSSLFYIHNLGTGNISTSIPALNQWHHVCCTFDAGSTEAFLNGVSVGTNTNGSATTNPNGANDFEIGRANNYNFYFNSGQVSNVALFNSSLTPSQVQTLYNNGSPEASISHSPVAWWKLDSTTITDSSGNGNTGTNSGATQVTSFVSTLNGTSSGMTTANLVNSDLTRSIPYSSYSMSFNGTDDEVAFASASSGPLNDIGTGDFTVSVWGNATTKSDYGTLIGNWSTNGLIMWRVATSNVFECHIGGDTFTTTYTIPFDDTWHHYLIKRSGTNVTVYVDGVSVATGTSSATLASGAISYIGNQPHNSRRWSGKISNPSIYNYAFSEDQVLTIYNGGVPNDISSLSPVGWWSLAGDSYYNGTDFICPDLGSGGNNGTSIGMGGTELVGNGPGSTSNGIATSMNIPENLQGNAPNSTKNAFSINMTEIDRETSVPDISS